MATTSAPDEPHYRIAPTPLVGVAMIVAYMVVFNGLQVVAGVDYTDYFDTAANAWSAAVIPLAAGALLLIAFVLWSRWDMVWRDPGRLPMGWVLMLAPVLFSVVLVSRFLGVDWPDVPTDLLVPIALTGILVGFAEETLFRGIVLRSLRTGGRAEGRAAVFTALLFGVFHTGNLLFGQSVGAVAFQVLMASLSGVTLYLFRRWSGVLVAAMIAHGLWDASLFFIADHDAKNLFSAIANIPGLTLVPLLGAVALVALLRGDRRRIVEPAGIYVVAEPARSA